MRQRERQREERGEEGQRRTERAHQLREGPRLTCPNQAGTSVTHNPEAGDMIATWTEDQRGLGAFSRT